MNRFFSSGKSHLWGKQAHQLAPQQGRSPPTPPSERFLFQFARKSQDCLLSKASESRVFRLRFASKTHYKSVNGANAQRRKSHSLSTKYDILLVLGWEARWKMFEICELRFLDRRTSHVWTVLLLLLLFTG